VGGLYMTTGKLKNLKEKGKVKGQGGRAKFEIEVELLKSGGGQRRVWIYINILLDLIW